MATSLKRNDLIHPQLSYRIVGILFSVYNELGAGHHERYYQRAIAQAFKEANISFREQVAIPVKFRGVSLGRYQLDFLVDGKVIVEIKKGDGFSKRHIDQVLEYLKKASLKLAILANFASDGVKFKRIINFDP